MTLREVIGIGRIRWWISDGYRHHRCLRTNTQTHVIDTPQKYSSSFQFNVSCFWVCFWTQETIQINNCFFFFVLLVFTTRYNWWDPPRIDESRFVSWQHLWRAHLVDWRAAIICNCMSGLLISINLVIEYFALQRVEYDGSFTYLEVKKYAATLFFWRGDRHLGMTQITRKDEFGLFGYLHYCYVCSDGSVTAAF